MKRWIHSFGIILTAASFLFFGAYLWRHAQSWPDFDLGPQTLATVAALFTFQILVATASALAWRAIVSFSGEQPLRPTRAIAIFCKSQFAKYIPGNIAHHLGRLLLARNEGLSAKRGTLSQTIEILWNLGCAGVLAVFGLGRLLATENEIASLLLEPWSIALFAALAILGPAILFPLSLESLKKRFPSRISSDAQISISLPSSIGCMAAYLLSFLFLGVALNALAATALGLPTLDLAFITSICALAWIAGFITPGSPAGIGIRDTILLLALQPHYGAEAAAALTLAHRLLTASGDLLVYLFGVALDRATSEKRQHPPLPTS